jgi:hypothetical protein
MNWKPSPPRTQRGKPQPKQNQLLTADLRGFTLINQKPLNTEETEAAEENQNSLTTKEHEVKGEGHKGKANFTVDDADSADKNIATT